MCFFNVSNIVFVLLLCLLLRFPLDIPGIPRQGKDRLDFDIAHLVAKSSKDRSHRKIAGNSSEKEEKNTITVL